MVVLHHLTYSRGSRVLWLLEELQLPYDLVVHQRDARFKAPAALAAIHPLGKSPVIVDGDLVIGESAVILRHLDSRYGGDRFSPAAGSAAWWQHEEWLQSVESTIALPVMAMRIAALTGGLSDGMRDFFAPVLARSLGHVEQAVRQNTYLLGERLLLADIQLSYLLAVADRGGLLAGYPGIRDYNARLAARPALQRALERGGPMMPPPA